MPDASNPEISVPVITRRQVCDAERFRAEYGDSGLSRNSELFHAVFRDLVRLDPYARDDDPVAFLAKCQGRVVCQIAVVPDELCIGKDRLRWFWGQSFETYPQVRGRGIGTVVIEALLREFRERKLCYGAYAMSPMSKRVWDKCGMTYLGRVARYVMLLDSDPLLSVAHWPKAARFPVRWPINLAARAVTGALAAAGRAPYAAHAVTEFGPELDAFLRAPLDGPHIHRSAASLNWRLAHVRTHIPGSRYQAFELRGRDGAMAGYGVTRTARFTRFGGRTFENLQITTLVDFRAHDPAAIRAALLHAVTQARNAGSHLFEVINGSPQAGRQARRLGMLHMGGYDMAYESFGALPKVSVDKWWLNAGESDAFFF